MRLEGRSALITGAGTGIGREIARTFSREGARVVVAELDEATGRAAAEELGDARFVPCDVSREADVKAAIDACIDAYGRLDIMVNNAGVSRQAWDRTIAVNLSGVYYGCRLAAERMAEQGGGVIVNMASMLGLIGVGAEDAYVATKHGVVGLTKNFAISYGQRGVRVNCLSPGWIETQMTAMIQDSPTVRQQVEQQTPLGRLGRPEEVAQAALFLASDDASFVTGHALAVDGGWIIR